MRSSRKGFTLVEMLVVLVIISLLTQIALAMLRESQEKAVVAKTLVEMEQMYKALRLLHEDTGKFPSRNPPEGVEDICSADVLGNNEISLSSLSGQLKANPDGWEGWNGPYMNVPLDPWGGEYILDSDYECHPDIPTCGGVDSHGEPKAVVILSCGPDQARVAGGRECDPDLKNRLDDVVYFICEHE